MIQGERQVPVITYEAMDDGGICKVTTTSYIKREKLDGDELAAKKVELQAEIDVIDQDLDQIN